MFLDHFNTLIFILKIKKYYSNTFINKNTLKNNHNNIHEDI
jgi:hypothetical protein